MYVAVRYVFFNNNTGNSASIGTFSTCININLPFPGFVNEIILIINAY